MDREQWDKFCSEDPGRLMAFRYKGMPPVIVGIISPPSEHGIAKVWSCYSPGCEMYVDEQYLEPITKGVLFEIQKVVQAYHRCSMDRFERERSEELKTPFKIV